MTQTNIFFSPDATSPSDCDRWWGKSHTWGRWEIVEKNSLVKSETKAKVGYTIIQKRTCDCCGFEQWDAQTTSLYD